MSEKKSDGQSEDQELNDLLDSALQDFNEKKTPDDKTVEERSTSESTSEKKKENSLDVDWMGDFLKYSAVHFEEGLRDILENDNEGLDVDRTYEDFDTAISRALGGLAARSEDLLNETAMLEMLRQTSLGDGAGAILPFMQRMLQDLLSKGILYPSLKELVDKYPEWLDEKKSTLSQTDIDNYTKQLELMRKVCDELEKEQPEDSEEVKKQRFETIVSLMQEVQGCGQLPEELVGEQSMPFQLDADGDPIVPSSLRGMDSPQNCCLM